MPDTKPREPETTAPTTGDGTPASAPGRTGDKTAKQDAADRKNRAGSRIEAT